MGATGDVRAEGDRSVAVGGDVGAGAVIVTGDHNVVVQVDGENALLLERLRPDQLPQPQPRDTPLDRRPARSPQHVDRAGEASALLAAIEAGGPVEVHGEAEIGKTFVLADALSRSAPELMPDGIAYVFAKGKALGDLLQDLFELFYDCRPRYVAGEAELREALADKRALLVLDALELERDELQQLVMAAPGCRFVLTSRPRLLWEGTALDVKGLSTADALAVVEQELGRPLADEERPAAERVCQALAGHPLKIRQAAAQVRAVRTSFDELDERLAGVQPDHGLRELLLEGLPPQQLTAVTQLAALGGATVGADRLAELLGHPGVRELLEDLERHRYVSSASPRYRAAGVLAEPSWPPARLAPEPPGMHAEEPAPQAVGYFTRWAAAQRRPEAVVAETEALRALLRLAGPREVIDISHAASNAFAQTRRWGTWGAMLEAALEAAPEAEDARSQAWALHQLGTRAFCLGDTSSAVRLLETALEIRDELGDRSGAEATRHNLDFISGSSGDDDDRPPEGDGRGPRGKRTLAVGAGVAATLIAGTLAAATVLDGDDENPAPPPVIAPRITVEAPREGARYRAGSRVLARYSCGAAARSCRGDVVPGSPIDTSPGQHVFTVRATDSHGETVTRQVSYTARPRRGDRSAPTVTIRSPTATTYEAGTNVPVDFDCQDDRGPEGLVCEGRLYEGTASNAREAPPQATEVQNGASLELAPGSHTLRVTATDRAGNRHYEQVTFTVAEREPASVTLTLQGERGATTDQGVTTYWRPPMPTVQLTCQGTRVTCSVTDTVDGNTVTLTHGQEIQAIDGPHTLRAVARGSDGDILDETVLNIYLASTPK